MKIKKHEMVETIKGYLFIAPNLLGFLIFTLIPVILSLILCFSKWSVVEGLKGIKFIGFDNFENLLTDELFTASVKNNFVFTLISVPISVGLALILAIILNKMVYLKNLLRAMFFIPYVTNVVAICLVWMMLFQPTYGPINGFLRSVGIENPPLWLSSEKLALLVIAFVHIWMFTGYNMVIYLSGLQAIPVELLEAGQIDGATGFKRFIYITLPLLSPTTFFILITGLINSFKVFAPVNLMTQGGPGTSTTVLVYYIYLTGFRFFKMGYASAIAWVLFVIVFIITLIQWHGQKKWVNYM